MNKIIVTGNLTRDAELKYTNNEKAYSKFAIANNEGYADNKKTTFLNCVLWGKSAENLNRFLVKGQKVLITGKLEINKFKDKDGIEKQIIEINVDMFGGVELLGSKGQASENNSNNNFEDDIEPIDDGDMPF